MNRLAIILLAFAICSSPAQAQQSAGDSPATETPVSQRAQRTAGSGLKAGEAWLEGVFRSDAPKNGFYVESGGLPPGSGLSAGPGYRRELFGGRATIDASAAESWSRGTFAQATVELPRLASQRVSAGVQVKRQDFTRVGFFGIGQASVEADRTEYRLENTDYFAFGTVKLRNWLTLGSRLGYSQPITIESPRETSFPATLDRFASSSAAGAPGLTDQIAFLHSDVYADLDTRNHPSRPTRGGDYRVTVSTFRDRDESGHSFQQVEGEASQFIPLLHENWVIALRARVAGSYTADGNTIPFYLLPTLGGSHSLRGYDDYRFSDRSLMLLNAEYRWRVFDALDGALFYDAGKVAPRFGDLDFTQLKSSYGLGFRFHSNATTVLRVDIGRSTEGTRLLLSMTDALRSGHGSIRIPYVP